MTVKLCPTDIMPCWILQKLLGILFSEAVHQPAVNGSTTYLDLYEGKLVVLTFKSCECCRFLYAFRWCRDFSVKINSENNSDNTIFIYTVWKKWAFYEFLSKSPAQKV